MGPDHELAEYDRTNGWTSLFKRLRTESQKAHDFSFKDSRRPEFRNRNRYGDVSPYDDSRVRLQRNDIDYINASTVVSAVANRTYLLTQGPLPETSGHFWLMVWEQKSQAIMMLNRVVEKDQIKCHQYYPIGVDNEGEDEMIFNDVGLKVRFIAEKESNYHYTARVLHLQDTQTSETREITQFHYTAWPDFGVPESDAFLDFLFAVRQSGALSDPTKPPTIHCSAGIGRSGTFCLVDTCLVLIEQSRSLEGINVCEILMDMRRYRMGLIQTYDQLRFSYLAIVAGARRLGIISAQSAPADTSKNNNAVESYWGSEESRGDTSSTSSSDSNSDDAEDKSVPTDQCMHHPAKSVALRRTNQSCVSPDNRSGGVWEGVAPVNVRTSGGHTEETRNGEIGRTETSSQDRGTTGVDSSSRVMDCGTVVHNDKNDNEEYVAQHEIKRRRRDERVKNTAEQLARMRRRQQEADIWQNRSQRLTPVIIVGISVAVAVVGFVLFRYFSA